MSDRVSRRASVQADAARADAARLDRGEATVVSLVASVDVLGKLATLGHSIIKRKADNDMAKFAEAVKKELEGGA